MTGWVLLRGLTRGSGHWAGFAESFAVHRAAHGDAVPVHTPDVPGNGRLHAARSPADVAAMVDACRAGLAATGVRPPHRLLGISLGGMLALDWARRWPDEVAGCVLVNTSLRAASPVHHRLRPAAWGPLLAAGVLRRSAIAQERAILRLTSARPGAAAGRVLADWTRQRAAAPVRPGNALRQLVAAARSRAAPDAPPVPTLLLASACDRLVDPRCSSALAARWRCPLAVHPWAGHDLTLDDPDWVAARIAGWLAGRAVDACTA